MPRDASDDEEASNLDVDRVAELANLPLDEAERDELEEACREVLTAFQLEETEEGTEQAGTTRTFADEADPWPSAEIEAILDAFPDRDGRLLRP